MRLTVALTSTDRAPKAVPGITTVEEECQPSESLSGPRSGVPSLYANCRAEKEDSPLTFILYPEGTLVSKDTRPISKKYADKLGIVRHEIRKCAIDDEWLRRAHVLLARHDTYAAPPLDGPAVFPAVARTAHTEPAAAGHHDGLSRQVPRFMG